MDDRSNPSEDAAGKRIREKEIQVLTELSAALNTLTSLQEVLDDIVTLTEPIGQSSALSPLQDKNKMTNVAGKQQKLLDELHQWQSISDNVSSEH
jgi:hypothetical protein